MGDWVKNAYPNARLLVNIMRIRENMHKKAI